jgi:cold shock CspA family protein
MPRGRIKLLSADRGFGFIITEQDEDFFFHRNDLAGVDYNSLIEGQQVEGQQVEFQVAQGPDSSCAVKARLIATQAS